MKQNPAPLGTVWTARAKIQIINQHTIRWKTLAACIDTPNAIREAVSRLVEKGVKLNKLWVVGDVTDRKMVCDLPEYQK